MINYCSFLLDQIDQYLNFFFLSSFFFYCLILFIDHNFGDEILNTQTHYSSFNKELAPNLDGY